MYNMSLPWWGWALMGAGTGVLCGACGAVRAPQPRGETQPVRLALYAVDDPFHRIALHSGGLLCLY